MLTLVLEEAIMTAAKQLEKSQQDRGKKYDREEYTHAPMHTHILTHPRTPRSPQWTRIHAHTHAHTHSTTTTTTNCNNLNCPLS